MGDDLSDARSSKIPKTRSLEKETSTKIFWQNLSKLIETQQRVHKTGPHGTSHSNSGSRCFKTLNFCS